MNQLPTGVGFQLVVAAALQHLALLALKLDQGGRDGRGVLGAGVALGVTLDGAGAGDRLRMGG